LVPEQEFEDREMVRKKEKTIEKTERRKEVQDAVNNGRVGNDYTDKQRLTKIEKNIKYAEELVEDLANENLTLARRVVELGRQVNHEEQRIHESSDRITKLENKTSDIEKEADKFEKHTGKKEDIKRTKYATYGFYALAIVAILVSIISLILNQL
jgi:cysteinyl-tRNA synthetase